MDKNRKRGERRDRTRRIAARRYRIEHAVACGSSWRNDCWHPPLWQFRRMRPFNCRCRGKTKGAPKLPGSLHKGGHHKYRDTVTRRIRNARLARAWLSHVGGECLDDIELPSGPLAGRRP